MPRNLISKRPHRMGGWPSASLPAWRSLNESCFGRESGPELRLRLRVRRRSGVLFQSSDGTPLHHSNTLHRQLRPTLARPGLPRFGMDAFRHYSVPFRVRPGMSFDNVRLRHGRGSEQILRMYSYLAPGHDGRTLRMIPNVLPGPIVGPNKTAGEVVELRRAV